MTRERTACRIHQSASGVVLLLLVLGCASSTPFPLLTGDGGRPVAAGGAADGGHAPDAGDLADAGAATAAADAGPGCVAPWSPTWRTLSASSWWAEFEIAGGGSLPQVVTLEVLSTGARTPLSYAANRWAGGVSNLSPGAAVRLLATDVTGATAQTAPFAYLVDLTPRTDPCAGTPSAAPGCRPLARGLVSFTMDDSLPSQATLALPVMTRNGVKATIYHVTNNLETYGGLPFARALAAGGHEVASHSRTHAILPALSEQALDDELRLSKQYLLANVGGPVESFATPTGQYSPRVLTAIQGHYSSHRTSNPGLNYVGSRVMELSVDGVYNSVTPAVACGLLQETAALRGWRIFVFHDFTSEASASSPLSYPVADFEALLRCAKATPGLDVVTVREGVAAIACGSP